MRAELRLLRQPFFFFHSFTSFPSPSTFSALGIFEECTFIKVHSSNATRKSHLKSKVALCQTSSLQSSIFGVSFVKNRRILSSSEKGKESKMSFAYASIKSKIRKFQVVLECRKRIAECLLSCDLLTSAAVVVSYCMIFPVGSDNAKESYRLRTSIGWPAPRGTGVFFCFLTSLNTDFFLPFLIQSRKSKKRA